MKGTNSKEYAEIKFEKAVIVGEEGNLLGAIEEVKAAICNLYNYRRTCKMQPYNIILQSADYDSAVQ